MATNRTRRTRGRAIGVGGFTEDAYQFFSSGPFFGGEDWAREKTEGEIEAFWKAHRREIMVRFMADLRRKGPGWEGNRPEYFWKELTAPRLPADVKLSENELFDQRKVGSDGLEADYAYLKRLGLLEDWELLNA